NTKRTGGRKMKFSKGKSGNPKGRPQGTKNKRTIELDELIDAEIGSVKWRRILRTLFERSMNGDVRAAQILIEHKWGKPRQRLDIDAAVGVAGEFNIEALAQMSIPERFEMLRNIKKKFDENRNPNS